MLFICSQQGHVCCLCIVTVNFGWVCATAKPALFAFQVQTSSGAYRFSALAAMNVHGTAARKPGVGIFSCFGARDLLHAWLLKPEQKRGRSEKSSPDMPLEDLPRLALTEKSDAMDAPNPDKNDVEEPGMSDAENDVIIPNMRSETRREHGADAKGTAAGEEHGAHEKGISSGEEHGANEKGTRLVKIHVPRPVHLRL